jgi:hypothetical protein
MRQLNGVYTQKYNWRYRKTGHLFQGRYKAIIIKKDSYLLELCRYVVLNPVRAHMVENPEDWRWSSYHDTAGTVQTHPFLSSDWILLQFSPRKKRAQTLYQRFVIEGITRQSPWNDLKGQIFLGDDAFIEEVKPHTTDREIPLSQRYAGRQPIEALFPMTLNEERSKRDKRIYEAHVTHRYTMKEIAEYLGVHYSTISRVMKRVENA